jgi:hypothetical protein
MIKILVAWKRTHQNTDIQPGEARLDVGVQLCVSARKVRLYAANFNSRAFLLDFFLRLLQFLRRYAEK